MSTAVIGYAPVTPRLHLTARGRRVLVALVAVPLVIGALLATLNGGQATATSTSIELEWVSVQPGQSLWQLAAELAPEADPRAVVDEIVSLNALATSELRPGQRIAIPGAYLD